MSLSAFNVGRLPFAELSRAVWPFVGAMLLTLAVATAGPALWLWLPDALGLG